MFGQLMKNICCRGNGIRAQIKFQTSLLRSSNQAICSSLIAIYIHIQAFLLLFLTWNSIANGYGSMRILTKMITVIQDFHICLCNFRFLRKLFSQDFLTYMDIPMEQPANKPQCKHIFGSHNRLIIQTTILQAFLTHGRYGCLHHFILDS